MSVEPDMRDQPEKQDSQTDWLSLIPGVLVFLGLYTHVLVLLGMGVLLAIAYLRGSRATRVCTVIGLVVGLGIGMTLWHPLDLRPLPGRQPRVQG